MNSEERAKAAEAVLNFLEEHVNRKGDVVRVIVEVEEQGQVVRRLRYRSGKGNTRIFERSYLPVPPICR